jgi:hypothetical protein
MKYKIALVFLLFFNFFFAQTAIKQDSVFAKKIKLFNTNFKEFEVVGNYIYATTKGDSLIVFNLRNDKITKIISGVVSITKNSNNEIVFINKQNKIIHYKTGKKKQIKIQFEPYILILDKNNNPIVISDKGLVYNDTIFEPLKIQNKHLFYRIKSRDDYRQVFKKPDLVFLDSKNRLWLTYDRGEFGEDILFFDIEKKVFFRDNYLFVFSNYSYEKADRGKYFEDLKKTYPDKIKTTETDTLFKFPNQLPISIPIRGIVEKDAKFFVSQSLIHFSINSHLFLLYDFDKEDFYKSFDLTKTLLEFERYNQYEPDLHVNEFLGPLHLNKFNKSIYYYSDKGFFKIIEDNGKYDKEFIFKPLINWSATNRNNLGADINVTKFEFISEKELVFLTTNNGIGYYNGTEVKYFQ